MRYLTKEQIIKELPKGEEICTLLSINERFETEPSEVKEVRESFIAPLDYLIQKRDLAGRSEAGRNFNIAITELENSCMRAIKGLFSK